MRDNPLVTKSLLFAARIVKLHRYLTKEKKDTIIAKQIVRSGTSIGANVNEANYGQSRADFIAKMSIALKEAAETEYWLRLLILTDSLSQTMGDSLLEDCLELKKLLVASVNTAKEKEDE